MSFLPVAAPIIGSIAGGLLGNKGAQQSANTAANAQEQISQQMFQEATQYQQQQQQALRSELAKVIGGGNPYFGAGQNLHPQRISPFQNATFFGAPQQPPMFGAAPQGLGNKAGGGMPPQPTPMPLQPGSTAIPPLPNEPRRPESLGGGPPALHNTMAPQRPEPGNPPLGVTAGLPNFFGSGSTPLVSPTPRFEAPAPHDANGLGGGLLGAQSPGPGATQFGSMAPNPTSQIFQGLGQGLRGLL